MFLGYPCQKLETPEILGNVSFSDIPKTLWLAGSREFFSAPKIAIVGTRNSLAESNSLAFSLARFLSLRGYWIISGMARGIDESAHRGALETGKTVGVLGTGLSEDVFYPRQNISLAKKMLDSGGALLSQFSPRTSARPYTFLKRNRVIALLCDMLLVVEAPLRSGALNTAQHAFELNKPVQVVVGNIFSTRFEGNRYLLKKGAYPLLSLEDLEKVLEEKGKKIDSLSEEEKTVLICIRQGYSTLSDLKERSGLSLEKLLSAISSLELKKKIKRIGPQSFKET